MKLAPLALAVTIALSGVTAPSAPAFAAAANPFATASAAPVRPDGTGAIATGTTRLPGDIPLRLAVYDPRTYELFWERVPGAVRYRLIGNGRTAFDGGGTSLFVAKVPRNTNFGYTLSALDRAGSVLKSVRFQVSLMSNPQLARVDGDGAVVIGPGSIGPTTPSRPTTPTAPVRPDGTGAIATGTTRLPGDIPLRLAVYDPRTYELFWERVPGAVRYRLIGNGRTAFDGSGTSLFVANVPRNTNFGYTLSALDRAGSVLKSVRFQVSLMSNPQLARVDGDGAVVIGPGSIGPTTPAQPTTPTGSAASGNASLLESVGSGSPLSVANYAKFLPAFYRIANAQPLEARYPKFLKVVKDLRAAYRGEANGFVAQSTFATPSSIADGTVFACPGGGTVAAEVSRVNSDADSVYGSFAGCKADGVTYRGEAGHSVSYPGDSASFFGKDGGNGNVRLPFEIVGSNGLVTRIDGYRFAGAPPIDSADYVEWNGNWTLAKGGKSLSVSMALSRVEDTGAGATFLSTGSFEGDLTNGRTITANDLGKFTSSGSPDWFTSGQVGLRDASGGILSLRAGESGTRDLTVRVDTASRVFKGLAPQTDEVGFRKYSIDR